MNNIVLTGTLNALGASGKRKCLECEHCLTCEAETNETRAKRKCLNAKRVDRAHLSRQIRAAIAWMEREFRGRIRVFGGAGLVARAMHRAVRHHDRIEFVFFGNGLSARGHFADIDVPKRIVGEKHGDEYEAMVREGSSALISIGDNQARLVSLFIQRHKRKPMLFLNLSVV